MLIIAGRNRGDRRLEIFLLRPLQILRLESLAGPAAGGCFMKLQCAADTAVVAGTLQQCLDLLDSGHTAILAELERALYFRRQLGVFEQLRHGFLLQVFNSTAILLQPHLQFGDLIDGGNSATGNGSKLAINLRPSGLRDLACSFRQAAIDAETRAD